MGKLEGFRGQELGLVVDYGDQACALEEAIFSSFSLETTFKEEISQKGP